MKMKSQENETNGRNSNEKDLTNSDLLHSMSPSLCVYCNPHSLHFALWWVLEVGGKLVSICFVLEQPGQLHLTGGQDRGSCLRIFVRESGHLLSFSVEEFASSWAVTVSLPSSFFMMLEMAWWLQQYLVLEKLLRTMQVSVVLKLMKMELCYHGRGAPHKLSSKAHILYSTRVCMGLVAK